VAASPAEIVPETGLAADREWRLLLAACSSIPLPEKSQRMRWMLAQPLRWKILLQLADRHGVQPLLCRALSGRSEVAREQMSRLECEDRANLHRALFLARELVRIVDHLSAMGIDAMPYKGLAVAQALYRDIALRQTGDIDLLIRAQDLARARAAVRELGYSPHAAHREAHERDYLKSGYELVFDGEAGPNLLELQWAIQPRFYAIDFGIEGMFRRAVTIEVAGHRVKTLCSEDLLLTLSAHAAKHVWSRVVWLCDIAQLTALPSLNWEWVAGEAGDLGISRIVNVTLLLANRLLDALLPASMSLRILKDRDAARLADEIQSRMSGEDRFNVDSIAYFRLMLRLRERRADQVKFLSRLVLTPGPGEWEAVHLPPFLSPFYRVVRLARLTGRLLGR
jgi:Uncharacterised nucleotidyltransferase